MIVPCAVLGFVCGISIATVAGMFAWPNAAGGYVIAVGLGAGSVGMVVGLLFGLRHEVRR